MTPGERGYVAYYDTAHGLTFDGRPMPTWELLGASPGGLETRRRWEVAALAVLSSYAEAAHGAWVSRPAAESGR